MVKGTVIAGKFGEIVVRQKSDEELELGELIVAENNEQKIILQVFDLLYGSQISQQNLELISGMHLEDNEKLNFMEANLRNYKLAILKNLIGISKNKAKQSKNLPNFFSDVREIKKEDLNFLTKPENALSVGNIRSGTKDLGFEIFLDGYKVFSHHILITGTTGKGKSVLMSNLIWNTIDKDYCAMLVLDPHDEYFGRNKPGMKDHPDKKVSYYTSRQVPVGQRSLKINLKNLRPEHLNFLDFSPPQKQSISAYFKKYNTEWIQSVIEEKPLNVDFNDATLAVVKRRLMYLLDLDWDGERLYCNGIFDVQAGENTISEICTELENAKTVIIDTSNFSGQTELLVGSLVASEILRRYKNYKVQGNLDNKPVVSIVLEEAPRVLGKEVLEKGSNVFASIAREGRKFKVGLTAITQLPSLIPRVILANMNTKIILGTEMNSERQAIIESASQDLSTDNRNIASLDKGEAIISSNFASFALPVKIPFFDERVKNLQIKKVENSFSGVNIQ